MAIEVPQKPLIMCSGWWVIFEERGIYRVTMRKDGHLVYVVVEWKISSYSGPKILVRLLSSGHETKLWNQEKSRNQHQICKENISHHTAFGNWVSISISMLKSCIPVLGWPSCCCYDLGLTASRDCGIGLEKREVIKRCRYVRQIKPSNWLLCT